jgi:glycosyltransferase involved in cell wall biosynthesis
MLRVLHVIPSLRWSPAERQLRLVLRYRSASVQHQVCVLRNGKPDSDWPGSAGLQFLGLADRLDLPGYHELRLAMRLFRPQIVHAWSPGALRVARLVSVGIGCGWLASEFSACSTRLDALLGYCISRSCGRGFRRLLPRWCGDDNPALGRCPPVAFVDYGVEVMDDTLQRRAARQQLQAQLGLTDECKLVGWVGDFRIEQRLKDAIWAADLLKVVRDDVHLVLAGAGPHLPRLMRYRSQVRISDRVHFVGDLGLLDATLSALDICWVTSESDLGTPLLLEAMARGIPVIATDTLSNRRFVTPAVTGLLFAVGHRAGLARLTHQLLDDPARAASLSRSAQATLADVGGALHVAAAYERMYEGLTCAADGSAYRAE